MELSWGNRRETNHELGNIRSIPAWAGEPSSRINLSPLYRVYPRVGGGTSAPGYGRTWQGGLSPRGRGNQVRDEQEREDWGLSPRGRGNLAGRPLHRSIPAWAGEPDSSSRRQLYRISVYPRVGGGTMANPAAAFPTAGLSPRGRGNREQVGASSTEYRSIPAWAGEPPR